MKRSFASLNPQEALHVAIFIEERNAELYLSFIKTSYTRNINDFAPSSIGKRSGKILA